MDKRRPAAVILVLCIAVATLVVATRHGDVSASAVTSGGWTTNASVSPTSPARGTSVAITATVSSASATTALVDVEVYNVNSVKVDQVYLDRQSFAAGVARTFTTNWAIPAGEVIGTHTVKIGIFTPGWGTLLHWNNGGATFTVSMVPTTSSTTSSSTSSSTSTTSTTVAAANHFSTLPPGSVLPSDQACASRVRAVAEDRPGNAQFNSTRGVQKNLTGPDPTFSRVDGNFTGTTDEVLQWVACKWGVDEDVVRAQAAVESWWNQTNLGDWSSDASTCAPGHPIGSDPNHAGQCPVKRHPR